jgi:acetyl esterase
VPVQRTVLPASERAGVEARCAAAGSEVCREAVKAFLAPFVQRAKPHPSKSVASVLLSKDPEVPHD